MYNKMSTIENISLECPCCKKQVRVKDTPLEAMYSSNRTHDWMQRTKHIQYDLFKGYIDKFFTGLTLDKVAENKRLRFNLWACNECLETGKAVLADTSKQHYGLGGPILYYLDLPFTCSRGCSYCGGSYVFTISEQKYWYEELNFFVESIPSFCEGNRKRLRLMKVNQKKLGVLINKKNKDVKDLEEIRDIYIEFDLLDKAKIINNQIKKVHNKT